MQPLAREVRIKHLHLEISTSCDFNILDAGAALEISVWRDI
jgi:hypothetical protein